MKLGILTDNEMSLITESIQLLFENCQCFCDHILYTQDFFINFNLQLQIAMLLRFLNIQNLPILNIHYSVKSTQSENSPPHILLTGHKSR